MREIKFRAIDAKTGKWVYGGTLIQTIQYYGDISIYAVSSKKKEIDAVLIRRTTIGQDTGLKDIKGKEIYEGDIVEFEDEDWRGDSFFNHGEIVYEYNSFTVSNRQHVDMEDLYDIDNLLNVEVIGNKYDNPELVEEK